LNREITDGGITYAIVITAEPIEYGINFVTLPDMNLQLGVMRYPAGKEIAKHRHLEHERSFKATQEVLFVQRGLIDIGIYNEDGRYLASVFLQTGDVLKLVRGSHSLIWERDSQVVEVKSGPYMGEQDKEWL